jgi:hypothetical protein
MAERSPRTFPEGDVPTAGDNDAILLAKILNSIGARSGAAAITPSNSADLPTAATGGIWVGTNGGTDTIKVDTVRGETVTFQAPASGNILPIKARRVYATGTTATNLIALY